MIFELSARLVLNFAFAAVELFPTHACVCYVIVQKYAGNQTILPFGAKCAPREPLGIKSDSAIRGALHEIIRNAADCNQMLPQFYSVLKKIMIK